MPRATPGESWAQWKRNAEQGPCRAGDAENQGGTQVAVVPGLQSGFFGYLGGHQRREEG